MSCQSLAPARAFPPPPQPPDTPRSTRHRSVRFSSESQSSFRRSTNDTECKRETPGSISLTTLVTSLSSAGPPSVSGMSQSAPGGSAAFGDLDQVVAPPLPSSSCRFPKLEECAHFHYERVSLGGLRVELVQSSPDEEPADDGEGWVCLRVRCHVNDSGDEIVTEGGLNVSWSSDATVSEWNVTRNADNFKMLDNMLHRCIYDRKVSGLLNLTRELTETTIGDKSAYCRLLSDYLHHLSIIADDTINCGPILNWFQLDNRGHRLLVANEDCDSINTPAVAAAYSVRKYVSQARDEISFEVGDMISIIDMPGPNESLWWRGKRGFKVGFFPHHCVAVIGDKVPRHMTQPPPIVGSVAVAPIKPVLRKHGKLISLFRSFILSRPSRRALKQQGILRERVFGCDLGEHLLNSQHDVPLVLQECARVIEAHGAVDGIYRLSGGSGLTQRLRAAFDEGRAPDLTAPPVLQDIHAVASLLKMYFRELPNPLCTYQLYEGFVSAVLPGPEDPTRLRRMRETVVKLPPPHYRTLSYLMRHLRHVSLLGAATGMTARNMAIVWAPNLLRSPHAQHALQGVAVQAVVTEFLICYAEELFSEEQGDGDSAPSSLEPGVELRQSVDTQRRPKSLPLNTPTKLLSLEEARQRGGLTTCAHTLTAQMPAASGAIAVAANTQLRPSSHKEPKYIEVGSGPNNLPQYHTVIELPAHGGAKRALKRSPSGWRGLFSLRIKHQRAPGSVRSIVPRPDVQSCSHLPPPSHEQEELTESPLRPVKSCESLPSEAEQLAPLSGISSQMGKQHMRSASCDSYLEPWQAELADMRLRLSPQERDGNMFSEEDDTTFAQMQLSMASTPAPSENCSVEPSPLRLVAPSTQLHEADLDAWERKRSKLEAQLSSIGYIDGDSPLKTSGKQEIKQEVKQESKQDKSPEKRHSDEWPAQISQAEVAKRLCKDRDTSAHTPTTDTFSSQPLPSSVKMRERSSPRKNRGSARYSGLHQPIQWSAENDTKVVTIVNQIGQNRVTWHGAKDSHSTLIKIDWPSENLTPSTMISPVTPNYDALESDSDVSEKCNKCEGSKKCLKCELTASGYENVRMVTDVDRISEEGNVTTSQSRDTMIVSQTSAATSQGNLASSLVSSERNHDSLESSPTNVSYHNLNRLSNISTSSNSEPKEQPYENLAVDDRLGTPSKVMTSSHESTSTQSNLSPKNDELYECFNFDRPNYINLQSSGSSKSNSPQKSPLRSTISITFKSPTKCKEDQEKERDSLYEDFDLDKNLAIVEDASVPEKDASLPTQEAAVPANFGGDLIILESPRNVEHIDVYSQVKIFRKSVEEVNAMIMDPPPEEERRNHYENVNFSVQSQDFFGHNECEMSQNFDPVSLDVDRTIHDYPERSEDVLENCVRLRERAELSDESGDFSAEKEVNYENMRLNTEKPLKPQLCVDRRILECTEKTFQKVDFEKDYIMNVDTICENAQIVQSLENSPKLSLQTVNDNKMKMFNVKQLATKFESPTEQKSPFNFDKNIFNFDKPFRETKYPTLDRKTTNLDRSKSLSEKQKKELSLKIPPPVSPKTYKLSNSNTKSLDENAFVKEFGRNQERELKIANFEAELNVPVTENKINIVQSLHPKSPTKSLNFDVDKKLSRERIERYKEERRNFLREKYSSQSFRGHNQDLKLKLDTRPCEIETPDAVQASQPSGVEELPKFERRNTVDLGQRLRFTPRTINLEASGSDTIERRPEPAVRTCERKEKISPSYNIKDMAAMFEQKSQNNTG